MDNLFFKDKITMCPQLESPPAQFGFVCGRCLFKQIKLSARKIPPVGAQKSEKSELPRKSTHSGLKVHIPPLTKFLPETRDWGQKITCKKFLESELWFSHS